MQKRTLDRIIEIAMWVLVAAVVLAVVWPIFLGLVALAAAALGFWFVYRTIQEAAGGAKSQKKSQKSATDTKSVSPKKGWDMSNIEEAELV